MLYNSSKIADRFFRNTCPTRRVIEILATDDDDDRSKGNGPPFYFRLDPNAGDDIRASFKVEHDPKGANGDGKAIVTSLRSFDRKQQKKFQVLLLSTSGNSSFLAGTTKPKFAVETQFAERQRGRRSGQSHQFQK